MAKKQGLALQLDIAKSQLGSKMTELERVKDKLSDVISERDFLRKILSNLSQQRH